MKAGTLLTRSTLGGLALALGIALPAAAEPPADTQLAQATPAPTPGARPQWGQHPGGSKSMHGHHGWHRRAKAHRFSLARVALRHQKDLGLSTTQVQNLQKLSVDARRDAIKRQADMKLARVDLGTLMMPDPADPNRARDMGKIEAKVRDIEKLRADGKIAQIRTMEQSRQVLTPEQREKLRTLLTQRWQHRGPQPGSGTRGMAPEDGTHQPTAAPDSGAISG
jgi:Spy/CpxP family protein refolding chaperone